MTNPQPKPRCRYKRYSSDFKHWRAELALFGKDSFGFGIDLGSPVGIEYFDQAPFKFNGTIEGAQIQYTGADATLNGQAEREVERPIPVSD